MAGRSSGRWGGVCTVECLSVFAGQYNVLREKATLYYVERIRADEDADYTKAWHDRRCSDVRAVAVRSDRKKKGKRGRALMT